MFLSNIILSHQVSWQPSPGPAVTMIITTVLSREVHSHWLRSVEILCSDWCRSWRYATPARLCHKDVTQGTQSPLLALLCTERIYNRPKIDSFCSPMIISPCESRAWSAPLWTAVWSWIRAFIINFPLMFCSGLIDFSIFGFKTD